MRSRTRTTFINVIGMMCFVIPDLGHSRIFLIGHWKFFSKMLQCPSFDCIHNFALRIICHTCCKDTNRLAIRNSLLDLVKERTINGITDFSSIIRFQWLCQRSIKIYSNPLWVVTLDFADHTLYPLISKVTAPCISCGLGVCGRLYCFEVFGNLTYGFFSQTCTIRQGVSNPYNSTANIVS